ncbi:unnamed protein product [Didymodactylos carnosus]|uniref:RAWUL domain-containing protein n=1 Tax=Didymodactylos carnosus TaxID=1234261 RepID=A0A813PEX9_9BILA|nr:unnamed protein product [Didymodactylos carnosus]CAF0988764.1 unnamed protein product [Didymodactylos carnosus]CAF3528868.1 unnamed protein product [Didymodactylos carnosus]CAF3758926.1 unnamed protein product [Didymodactylos carnosus]
MWAPKLRFICRTCIVNYFNNDENNTCPICYCTPHPAKPLLSLKKDRNLQYLVYKIIPNLFKNEMFERRQFYSQNDSAIQLNSCFPEEELGELSEIILKTDDIVELMNVLIEYNEKGKLTNSSDVVDDEQQSLVTDVKTEPYQQDEFNKNLIDKSSHHHYLQCSSNLPICILKKFLKKSLCLPDITPRLIIDIMYDELLIKDHFTLNDIVNIYGWRRKKTSQFHLFYRIRKEYQEDLLDESNEETLVTNDKQQSEELIEETLLCSSLKINTIIENNNEEQTQQPVLQPSLTPENLPVTFLIKSPCKVNSIITPIKKKYNRKVKRINSEHKRQQHTVKSTTQPLIMPRGATILALPAGMILKNGTNIFNLAPSENKTEVKLDNEHKSTTIKTYYSHTSNNSPTSTSFNGLSSFLPITPSSNLSSISPNKVLLQKTEQQQFENEIIPLKEHNAIMLHCNTVTSMATPINYTLNSTTHTSTTKHNADNDEDTMKIKPQIFKRYERQHALDDTTNLKIKTMNSPTNCNSYIMKPNDSAEQCSVNNNLDLSIIRSDVSSIDFVEATPDHSIDKPYCSVKSSDFVISKSVDVHKEEILSPIIDRPDDSAQMRNTHSYSDVIKEANKVLTDEPTFTSITSINSNSSENGRTSNAGRPILKLVKPIATVSPLNSTINNCIEQKQNKMVMSIDDLPKQISNNKIAEKEDAGILRPNTKRRLSKILPINEKIVQVCEPYHKEESNGSRVIEQTSSSSHKNKEYSTKHENNDLSKKEDKQEVSIKDILIKRSRKTSCSTSSTSKNKTKKASKNTSQTHSEEESTVIKRRMSNCNSLPNAFLSPNQQQMFQQHAAFFNIFNYSYLIDPSAAMIMNACDPRFFTSPPNSWAPPFDITHLSRMRSSIKNYSTDPTSKTPHDLNSVSLKDFIESKSKLDTNETSTDIIAPLNPFHNSEPLTSPSTDLPTPLSTQDNLLSLTRTSSSNSFHSCSRGENDKSKQNHSSKSNHHSSRSSSLTLSSNCSANVLASSSISLTTVNGASS